MKIKVNEQNILKFLKFSPPIITIFFSAFVITLIYFVNEYSFTNEITKLKDEFRTTNKALVKNEVEKVYTFIEHQKEQTESILKKNIKENVNIVHELITKIYLQNKNKSKKEIKKIIKQSLQDLRFNEGIGYFFIVSHDGEMIFHPYLPELEDTNVSKTQDPNGTLLFENMISLIKEKKESFYEWYWYKPNVKTNKEKKVGYIKDIDGLNWFIGSGYYVDDFEKLIKKDIFTYIPKIKFGQSGYIFMIDYEGNSISSPNKDLTGKNILNAQDKAGNFYVKTMIDAANKGNGFMQYYDSNLPLDKTYLKTSYVKGVPDWELLIGAGFNEDELNNKIIEKQAQLNEINNKNISKLLIISSIITVFLTLIALYVSKIIQNLFIQYKTKIAKEIEKNHEKDMMLAQQTKMNALGDMIGNIAHQWRQPLSTITTASTGLLLKYEYNSLEGDDLPKFTKLIDDNAQYLSKTIEEFKDFFDKKDTKELFDIEHTVQKTLNIISSQFLSHNIQIITNVEKTEIYGIENELMQMFINILNNSKEALIRLNLDKKLIFIDVYTKRNNIYIEIKDNAQGIAKSHMNRIFEPYFTTKFKAQGTGVGLYMCYEIITKHFNGTIDAENSEYTFEENNYVGAKFTLTIPTHRSK